MNAVSILTPRRPRLSRRAYVTVIVHEFIKRHIDETGDGPEWKELKTYLYEQWKAYSGRADSCKHFFRAMLDSQKEGFAIRLIEGKVYRWKEDITPDLFELYEKDRGERIETRKKKLEREKNALLKYYFQLMQKQQQGPTTP